MKLGHILVYLTANISSMFLVHWWRLETSSRPFYVFNEMTINEICQFLVVDIYHFQFSLIHSFKVMKYWKLDINGCWIIGAGCLIERASDLALLLQILQKISENYCPFFINQLTKFGELMSCGLKGIFKNVPCLIY